MSATETLLDIRVYVRAVVHFGFSTSSEFGKEGEGSTIGRTAQERRRRSEKILREKMWEQPTDSGRFSQRDPTTQKKLGFRQNCSDRSVRSPFCHCSFSSSFIPTPRSCWSSYSERLLVRWCFSSCFPLRVELLYYFLLSNGECESWLILHDAVAHRLSFYTHSASKPRPVATSCTRRERINYRGKPQSLAPRRPLEKDDSSDRVRIKCKNKSNPSRLTSSTVIQKECDLSGYLCSSRTAGGNKHRVRRAQEYAGWITGLESPTEKKGLRGKASVAKGRYESIAPSSFLPRDERAHHDATSR